MEFEVLLHGIGKMITTSWVCVPNAELLSVMKKQGYTFKIDGKTVTISKIEELRKNK